MYLILVWLDPAQSTGPDEDLLAALRAASASEEQVDHVSVVVGQAGRTVVGAFVTAVSVARAEDLALSMVRRVLSERGQVDHLYAADSAVAIVAEYHDRLFGLEP